MDDGRLDPAHLATLRPRLIALVPDQLKQLLDDLPADNDVQPVRIISGGGPVPPALARRTRLQLTGDLRSVYGASETGSIAVADLALLEAQAGAAGFVLPLVEVEIVDEQGDPQPHGTLGRIRVSSNRVADHFVGQAAAGERWFDTGDLGRLGSDGALRIEGRVDDIMNLAGHRFCPAGWRSGPTYDDRRRRRLRLPDDHGLDRCCWRS